MFRKRKEKKKREKRRKARLVYHMTVFKLKLQNIYKKNQIISDEYFNKFYF
jgi:hypothetical protein